MIISTYMGSGVLRPRCANSYGWQFHCAHSLQVYSPCQYRSGCPDGWDQSPDRMGHGKELEHLQGSSTSTLSFKIQRIHKLMASLLCRTHKSKPHADRGLILYLIVGTQMLLAKIFTSCIESQLSAGNYCIKISPGVITHSAPGLIPANLHTTLVDSCSSHESDVSISAWH